MFWKKNSDYIKAKDNKQEENSKNKNFWEMYKGINEFKKKHDGTIVADTTSILTPQAGNLCTISHLNHSQLGI
jgi:hypothetical protein